MTTEIIKRKRKSEKCFDGESKNIRKSISNKELEDGDVVSHENDNVEQNNNIYNKKKLKKPWKANKLRKPLQEGIKSYQEDAAGSKEKLSLQIKSFRISDFRKKLQGYNFNKDLQHFLYLIRNKRQTIDKYFEDGGDPTEFSIALERVEKANLQCMYYLIDALQMLLMEVLTNFKNHMEAAVRASRHFVKNHIFVAELFLKSKELEHRKCALKMLTAIVCAVPELGMQLLASFDILSDVQIIRKYLSHSMHDTGDDTIRKCYIHFVLAFLVEGNKLLIVSILRRNILLKELIFGLVYDDHVTVCVVLSTLKQYVIENREILKTMKYHFFNLDCIRNLLKLYDWLGPCGFKAKFQKGNDIHVPIHELMSLVNPMERDAVSEAAHELLLVLLTSRRYGIVFNSMNVWHIKKRNVSQSKALAHIRKAYLDERKTDLVVQVVHSCPEIARSTVNHFSEIINGTRIHIKEWVSAYNFMEKLISSLHPYRLKFVFNDNITLTEYASWMREICLPINILSHITESKSLKNKNYDIRYATNRLLFAMFNQYSNYMIKIQSREDAKGNSLRRFKFNLLDYILANFPTVDDILSSLHESIASQDSNPEIDIREHLELTLDLLLVICKEHPTFITKTSAILDFLQLLRPLYTSENNRMLDNKNITIELKAIKTILSIAPKTLEADQPIFENVLQSFIHALVYGRGDVQREACNLTREIFINTGMFETSELEIDIWLETLCFFEAETIDIIVKVFIECFRAKNAKVDRPVADVNILDGRKSLQQLFENIEKGLIVQGYVEPATVSKLLPLILKGVIIVKPLEDYLKLVYLLMFYYFPMPQYVHAIGSIELATCNDYMKGWLNGEQTDLRMKFVKTMPFLAEIHAAVLGSQSTFEEIFKISTSASDESYTVELRGKILQLNSILANERIVNLYIQEILFLVAQLTQHGQLNEMQAKSASNFIANFLEIIHFSTRENENQEVSKIFINFSSSASFLHKILQYIFNHRFDFIRSSNLFHHDIPHINFMKFLLNIINRCCSFQLENFDQSTYLFRMKIVKAIEASLMSLEEIKKKTDLLEPTIRVVEAIQLSLENCTDILKHLSQLSYKDFFDSETEKKTIYMDLLQIVFQRLSELKKSVICEDFFTIFTSIYIDLLTKPEVQINLEHLEESLHQFLIINHQNIHYFSSDVFWAIFKARKTQKSTVKIACLLLERNSMLFDCFIEIVQENFSQKELIYPLLNIALSNGFKLDDSILERIYQECKNGIMKTIEKPQKAGAIYKGNIMSSKCLIDKFMPAEECINFCTKNHKFDVIEIYQVKIIEEIFRKALAASVGDPSSDVCQTIFFQFINLCIQMFIAVLKRDAYDEEKITLLAYTMFVWCKTSPKLNLEMTEKILQTPNWMQFCKICLKTGMFMNENEEISEVVNRTNGQILKLLAFLCNELYSDVTMNDNSQGNEQAAQLYEMVFAHSKFFQIVSNEIPTEVKTGVMHLLSVLARKSTVNVLNGKHIPLILGAYQAKLSNCDCYTLALLQIYEQRGMDFQRYRPFVWGESAIAFYSLHSDNIEKTNLNYQETSVEQVMQMIDYHISEYTVDNFPQWRKLNPGTQLPKIEFENPDRNHLAFGSNSLERKIEAGILEFTSFELRNCPKSEDIYTECYDPAFILPLMAMCFAPEMYAYAPRPVQNGLLSIVFAALSSQDKDMRLAAGFVQQRYRQHFENRKFFDKAFWSQMYDNIQAGLDALRESWMKENTKNSGVPRAPFIASLFLAKTINVTMYPLDMFYRPLTMFMCLKRVFNFQCIPEFNTYFYSSEIEHSTFRHFILNIIRNGIKTSSDLYLVLATHTFKVLMGFYGCTISTLETNLLILSLFSTCAKIPASSKIMIDQIGIIQWLNSILNTIEFYEFNVIEGIISILNNLWYSVRANANEFENYSHIQVNMHCLIIRLLPNLSGRITLKYLAKLLNIFNKTSNGLYGAVSEIQLNCLLGCVQKHFGANLHIVVNIKENGYSGAASYDEYCKSLYLAGLDATSVMAISSLREYVIQWSKYGEQQKLKLK